MWLVAEKSEITRQLEKQGLGFTVCTSCEEVLAIEGGSLAAAPGLPQGLVPAFAPSPSDLRRCSRDGAPLLRCPPVGEILVGDYQFLSLIGVGGMGGVFKCRHRLLDKTVAVKRLLDESVSERDKLRFKQEAQVLSKLQHKNLVTVYDFGFDGAGLPYLAMEYIEGQTLSQILKLRQLSLEESLLIFEQCLAGLECAHRAGVIHRDIKPGNLILRGAYPDLELKILDFGIAKAATGAGGREGQSLTSTGEVFGSPLYMSPEQALGRAVDERTDLYSLGCVLFEMLFGAPPFRGANSMETVFKHVNEEPVVPVRTAGGASPGMRLTGLLASMLSKDPAARPRSAHDCRLSLEAIRSLGPSAEAGTDGRNLKRQVEPEADESGAADSPAVAFKSSPAKRVLVAVILIVLVGILGLAVFRPGKTSAPGAVGEAEAGVDRTIGSADKAVALSAGSHAGSSPESLEALVTADRAQVSRLIEKYRRNGRRGDFKLSCLHLLAEGIDELNTAGKDLTRIELEECTWTDKTVARKLSSCGRESLSLRKLEDLNDEQFRQLCRTPGLKDLTLQACPFVTESGLIGLKQLKEPRHIELSQMSLSHSMLNNILPMAGMKGLVIDPIKDNLGRGWLDSLAECKSLPWLRILNVDISTYSLSKLGRLPHLQALSLNGCNGVTPALLKQLRLVRSLTVVYLGGSDARADSVKAVLENCPGVTVQFGNFVPDPEDAYLKQAVRSGRLQIEQ